MDLERKEKLPDFLIIGAGKSGTTSLDYYLNQHPNIFLPNIKEPNFLAYSENSVDDFHDHETQEHFLNSVTKIHDYLNLFVDAQPDQKIGEISNTTLYMPNAISAIKKYIGSPKIIAILRNPADRLYSRYMHLARVDKKPTNAFEDLFIENSIGWKRADLINEGFYYQHLSKFYKFIHADQIKVILYEDFKNKTNVVLRDLCTFLEINNDFIFETATAFNKSGEIKNRYLHNFMSSKNPVFKTIKNTLPSVFYYLKKNKTAGELLENIRNRNLKDTKLSVETKRRIINEIYLQDLKSLELLIGKDLSHWHA